MFISITRLDKRTRLIKRTHQMAYICEKTEDLVLSREAMTVLGIVSASIDDAASVRQISSSTPFSASSL